MANDMTDSYMAGTTISRHVGELEPLTQSNTWHGRNRFMIATLQAHATHHKAFHGITM